MQKFASVRIISPENKANDETKSEGLNIEKKIDWLSQISKVIQ